MTGAFAFLLMRLVESTQNMAVAIGMIAALALVRFRDFHPKWNFSGVGQGF